MQQPDCFISAWPNIIIAGQSSTVTWRISDASSRFISGIGNVPASGTRIVRPDRNTTYTLSASGAGGSCVLAAAVTVHANQQYGYFQPVVQSFIAPLYGGNSKTYYAPYTETWYYEDVAYDTWTEYYVPYQGLQSDEFDCWTYSCGTEYYKEPAYYEEPKYFESYYENYYESYYESYYENYYENGYGWDGWI